MELAKEHPSLNKVSTNNHLRFLHGCKWDAKAALEFSLKSEKYRVDNQVHLLTQEKIRAGIDLNYVKTFGHDKCGRPLFWIKVKNYKTGAMTNEQAMNFLCYIFDYTCTLMTPNVDQIIAILDMADFSY